MRLSLFAAAALCASTLAAHADTIFNVSGSTYNGATLSGTITLDSTTSQFTSSNVSYTLGSTTDVFNLFVGQGRDYNGGVYDTELTDTNGDTFGLRLPGDSLAGYQGSSICIDDNCPLTSGGSATSPFYFVDPTLGDDSVTSGSLTALPSSDTPEPSSFALLGTGLLGALGVARKRFS